MSSFGSIIYSTKGVYKKFIRVIHSFNEIYKSFLKEYQKNLRPECNHLLKDLGIYYYVIAKTFIQLL